MRVVRLLCGRCRKSTYNPNICTHTPDPTHLHIYMFCLALTKAILFKQTHLSHVAHTTRVTRTVQPHHHDDGGTTIHAARADCTHVAFLPAEDAENMSGTATRKLKLLACPVVRGPVRGLHTLCAAAHQHNMRDRCNEANVKQICAADLLAAAACEPEQRRTEHKHTCSLSRSTYTLYIYRTTCNLSLAHTCRCARCFMLAFHVYILCVYVL